MSGYFHAGPLSDDNAMESLPLVRTTWPKVTLTAWQEFLQFRTSGEAELHTGVVGLRDSMETLCGIFTFRGDMDLEEGLVLTVDLFSAVDLANSVQIVSTLLDIVEAKAVEMKCSGIHIRQHKQQSAMIGRLRRLGFADKAHIFSKKITATHAAH